MQDAERLITEFTGDYMGKLFYFCLKKTGNSYEAEDLSSDISVCIFTELRKGTLPSNFPAWVWRIARNRYSAWADAKHRRSLSVSGTDISDFELADGMDIENDFVHGDDISRLRRELAFISSEYREIVVAYYIENRSVRDIAASLSIPEGTVKTKLFRARNILKEGMNMAREFGKRSYDPEEIYFCSSGNQPSGLPFSAVQRKAPKNILCTANNNPSTIEELSIELGIAAPYMEEEVKLLVESELLVKLDNGKCLTNFFISPKECQTEINDICCDYSENNCEAIWNLAGKALEKARGLGVLNGTLSDDDAQMYFAFYIEQKLTNSMFAPGLYGNFKRADGGNWGFIGYEQGSKCRLPIKFFNNMSAFGYGNKLRSALYCADGRSISAYGQELYKSNNIYSEMLIAFAEYEAAGYDISKLSENDRASLDKAVSRGFFIQKDDGSVVPQMLVFRGGAMNDIMDLIKSDPEYKRLSDELSAKTAEAKCILGKYCSAYLKDDFDYYVMMSLDNRSLLSRLWKDKGLYKGGHCQFMGLFINA